MEAFIEQYLAWCDDLLRDPADQRRTTIPKRMRDLEAHQAVLYERLLRVSAGRSLLGYAETTITLQNDVEFYRLPGNFRRFIGFEKRIDGSPRNTVDRMNTVADWDRASRGLILSTPERGFRVRPMPALSADETWTLRYQKKPIVPHYGVALAVTPDTIQLPHSIPAAQGTLIRWPDYYKGEVVHVLDAETGAGQAIEVLSSSAVGVCTLRHNWLPMPSGPVKYEFPSFLPREFNKLLAMSVALAYTSERTNPDQRRLLLQEWKEMFSAAKHYYHSSTVDRPDTLNHSRTDATVDPFAA